MEITAEDGLVIIRQDGDCIQVPVEHIASMVGRLTRAALEAQHQMAVSKKD